MAGSLDQKAKEATLVWETKQGKIRENDLLQEELSFHSFRTWLKGFLTELTKTNFRYLLH